MERKGKGKKEKSKAKEFKSKSLANQVLEFSLVFSE